jgi:hypothetical protein
VYYVLVGRNCFAKKKKKKERTLYATQSDGPHKQVNAGSGSYKKRVSED